MTLSKMPWKNRYIIESITSPVASKGQITYNRMPCKKRYATLK